MDRKVFKGWFTEVALSLGVTSVEFRKLDQRCPMKGLNVGNYNVERNDIWVIEEWKDRYLPTPELIYFSLHELGHHLQWLRGQMHLNDDGLVPGNYIPELEVGAHSIASRWASPLIGKQIGPFVCGQNVVLPLHGEQ